jgi:hypothetical protein
MARNRFRRQVGGTTTKGDRITVGHVSSNGDSLTNARAKGSFGYSLKQWHKPRRKNHGGGRP